VQIDDILHVDLGEGVGTTDLEQILDALGTFSQGFTVGKEIVFDLPEAPLSNVAAAFLSVVADTIRRNGIAVRIEPEPGQTGSSEANPSDFADS